MVFHRNLQSLLSIISWRDISYRDVFIQVNEDFCIYPTGEKGNPRFRRLITKRYGIWERPAHTQPYLFSFKDLGAEGLTEWFSLCSRYSTPMRQLFHIVRMHRYMTLESQVLVFAIALEELCDALREEGCEEKREKWCFATKLSCILKDILDRCPSVPKMRIDDISEVISNTYASIKHTKPARHGKSGKIGFLLIIYFKLLWCAG